MTRDHWIAVGIASLTLCQPVSAEVAPGDIKLIQCPGAERTVVFAVNNRGDVAGECHMPDGPRAFVLRKGIFTTLHIPSASESRANGLNDRGDVVGNFFDEAEQREYGFLYSDGLVTKISVPNAETTASAIANNGTIVGLYELQDASGNSAGNYGFILEDGEYRFLSVPGAAYTAPSGINERGAVVGVSDWGEGASYGFLFDGKNFIKAPAPDLRFNDIDNSSRIVGDDQYTCYIRRETEDVVQFSVPGAVVISCTSISDSGYLTGWYGTGDGWIRSFLTRL